MEMRDLRPHTGIQSPLRFMLNYPRSSPFFMSLGMPSSLLKQRYENNKLTKKLRHLAGDAINEFAMIEPGDKIMVCLSGGKDSYALLDILLGLRQSAPIDFSLIAVNLDQKQPGFPEDVLPNYLRGLGIPYRIVEEDTYSLVQEKVAAGKIPCSLCSRLRRGILYRIAKEEKATKIALGHHRDDILETLFLNLFYGGQLKTMPPKLLSDNGEHVIIRPLAYVPEKLLSQYAVLKEFPIIPCGLCGNTPHSERRNIKAMLEEWEKKYPGRAESIFSALRQVVPSHLVDTQLFDFAEFKLNSEVLQKSPDSVAPVTFRQAVDRNILASK